MLLYGEDSWQELVCLGTQTQTTSNMPPRRRNERIIPRFLSHVCLLLDPELIKQTDIRTVTNWSYSAHTLRWPY